MPAAAAAAVCFEQQHFGRPSPAKEPSQGAKQCFLQPNVWSKFLRDGDIPGQVLQAVETSTRPSQETLGVELQADDAGQHAAAMLPAAVDFSNGSFYLDKTEFKPQYIGEIQCLPRPENSAEGVTHEEHETEMPRNHGADMELGIENAGEIQRPLGVDSPSFPHGSFSLPPGFNDGSSSLGAPGTPYCEDIVVKLNAVYLEVNDTYQGANPGSLEAG